MVGSGVAVKTMTGWLEFEDESGVMLPTIRAPKPTTEKIAISAKPIPVLSAPLCLGFFIFDFTIVSFFLIINPLL